MQPDDPISTQETLASPELTGPDQPSSTPSSPAAPHSANVLPPVSNAGDPWETRALVSAFMGPRGLRAGWSILCFLVIWSLLTGLTMQIFLALHLINPHQHGVTPRSALFSELATLLPAMAAAAVLALIERHRGNLLVYNLQGPRRAFYFVSGLIAGFLALSALVGSMYGGHWLTFGAMALSGAAIAKYAAIWAVAFLAVACFEEGTFRCYFQSTLTRGLNFWWAFGILAVMCGVFLLTRKGNGVGGVYLMAALGLLPCAYCEWNKTPHRGFWFAAWVTSTCFGALHTGNHGETWIGIFAAALIGFVFCVSIYVTGSAWWAIGCHAGWDWAETYFYGTADSGMVAPGHLLSTSPAGNVLWSGGSNGPEGSLLVLPIILLLLGAILVIYGRRSRLPVADDASAA